ncbi:hypothetical protein R3W88_027752 [Solanum pinnatisectum]|uniref:Copper transport protein n=1 Tax=Solanum pinnatisectum TaxID=50273 RepID=A0AAV9LHQ5_9SOLN|nr:hypothetical protein R3W88_027752 [Solanum pinnatisectum]
MNPNTPPLPMAWTNSNETTHIHPRTHLFHLSFYWGRNTLFLFPNWPGNSRGMYGLGLIFVFVLAILVEFFSNLKLVKPGSNRAAAVFFQAGVQAVRAGFAYMVMLAVMSYNGGVFIAAILGHAVGYVVFGSPIFKKDMDR